MLHDPFFLTVVFAVFVVIVILFVGVIGFGLGGEFNRKHSNRIMRYRLVAQAIAIVLIVAYVIVRRSG